MSFHLFGRPNNSMYGRLQCRLPPDLDHHRPQTVVLEFLTLKSKRTSGIDPLIKRSDYPGILLPRNLPRHLQLQSVRIYSEVCVPR